MPIEHEISQSGAVTTVRFNLDVHQGQWFLLRSDAHHDSIACNRDLELEHLEKAKKRDAFAFDGGDLFDAMQGRFDPRRSMDELRPEYRRGDYFDYVIKDCEKFYGPYAENFLVMARGNHEVAVRKHASTDLTDRLVYSLNAFHEGRIVAGGFGGWLRIVITRNKKYPLSSLNIKYFHGAGGEAPVTKGVIQTNRQAVYLPDAHVVLNGHNHWQYILPLARERLGQQGNHYSDLQYHVRIPGYHQGYGDGTRGWNVETGKAPKPIGCVWMWIENCGHDRPLGLAFHADTTGPEMAPIGEISGPDYEPFPEDSEYP